LKKKLISLIKLGLPLAIFVYLLSTVDPADYAAFWNQPKRWGLLILAQAVAILAVVIGILRWRLLVLYLDIPFTTTEALRLGFIGNLMNFVSLGSVGGDLFKAILAARKQPSKKPEAVASVLLDRAVGLLGLIMLASFCIALFGDHSAPKLILQIGRAAGALTVVCVVSLLIGVYSGNWLDRWIGRLDNRVPVLGPIIARMARAVRLLRQRSSAIPLLIISSLSVHTLLTLCVCLVSWGIYQEAPTVQQHFMVVPPAMAAGAIPLAPGGLGIQEGAIVGLFKTLPQLPPNYSPVLVATVFRLMTLSVAGIGVGFLAASHGRELQYVRNASS
jgi:glycosyltransferase 2 family protein